MDTKMIGKWAYLGGLLVAVLAALFEFSADWLSIVLMLVGIFIGIFVVDTEDLTNFAIRWMAMVLVAGSLDALPFVGEYITTFFTATYTFLGPILLTALLMWFVNKYFKS